MVYHPNNGRRDRWPSGAVAVGIDGRQERGPSRAVAVGAAALGIAVGHGERRSSGRLPSAHAATSSHGRPVAKTDLTDDVADVECNNPVRELGTRIDCEWIGFAYVKLRAWEKTASKLASAQAAREKRVVAEAKLSHRRAAADRAPAAVLLLSHTDVLQPVRRART